MGKSFFLDNRGLHVAQACLLAFCILLCLKSGVDAVQCNKCSSGAPNAPCKPSGLVCEGSFCTLMKVYDAGAMTKYYKDCGDAKSKAYCGKDWHKDKKIHKMLCCETNQCN